MGAPLIREWLGIARQAMTCGRVQADSPRCAVSRLYFAAYAGTHAVLLALGESPPLRGNWPHRGFDLVLKAALPRAHVAALDAKYLSHNLLRLYDLRIAADYSASRVVGPEEFAEARRLARQLVHLAERIVR